MKKTTDELLEQMKNSRNYAEYKEANKDAFISMKLDRALNVLLEEKKVKKAEVIRRSSIESHYAYQIFSGEKTPTRDKVIMICIGFQLSPEETQNLLKITGYAPLYSKNERDNAILFGLTKGNNVITLNILLADMNLEPLM